jgi:hypothetical protein
MKKQGQIEFRRSGHFWIDLGVIALWRRLAEGAPGVHRKANGYVAEYDEFEALLRADALQLSGQEDAIFTELRAAVDALRAQVWQPTKKGKIWWSGIANFLRGGTTKLEDFIINYEELGTKAQWRGSGSCSICGRDDLPVRTTATHYNPLTVSMDKMSTFYSELSGRETICQACAFASPFAFTRAWHSIQGSTATLVWPVAPDFVSMDKFFRSVSRHFVVAQPFRNYPSAVLYAQSPAACFLDVLCSLWDINQKEGLGKELVEALTRAQFQFHALQLTKAGNTVSADRYEVIPDPAGILRLVQACDQASQQGKRWNALQSTLSAMPIIRRTPEGRTEADTHLLDAVSRTVVVRGPVDQAIEERVYAALDEMEGDAASIAYFPVVGLRMFIPIYLKEVKDMTVDLLPSLQSVGTTLGELVKQTDDRSILYNLRNARNPDDLLEVLSRAVVRHSDDFIAGKPELYRGSVRKLAESIDQTNWRRVRSLLGIYAGLRFIELSKPHSGQQSS